MPRAPDLSPDAPWKRRFRAWSILFTSIAAQNPARGLVSCNRSGVHQLHAWDVAAGELRQLTRAPAGKILGTLSPDGRFVYYHDDAGGNEIGQLVRIPWEGGEPQAVTPDFEPYALAFANPGLSRDGSTLTLMTATREGFQLFAIDVDKGGELGAPRRLWHAARMAGGPVLSHGGELAVVAATERTRSTETSLVAIDVASGEVVAELFDPDASVDLGRFSRTPGDLRLLGSTTRSGQRRPVLWAPRSGERSDFELTELQGDAAPVAWSNDARHALVLQVHRAETRLHRLLLAEGRAEPWPHPRGTVGIPYYTPQGDVVASIESSVDAPRWYRLPPDGHERPPVLLEQGAAPPGHRWRSVSFASTGGAQIQAWLATPDGNGPFPTILEMHGGPTAVMTERYYPRGQLWVDHGFAFLSINFRGSSTFGRDFQLAIHGQLGRCEVQDMAAARDWLVKERIADPAAILLTGWSYGGYLTLLGLGVRPDLWAGGMAGIAIGDWRLMYEDQTETLKRFQVGLFGGTPDEKPEAHAESSPITYAERVRAPVLVVQGSNDTRCPPRQLRVYEQRMRELGKAIEVVWFEAGHGSYAIEQSIELQEHMLRFAFDVVSASASA